MPVGENSARRGSFDPDVVPLLRSDNIERARAEPACDYRRRKRVPVEVLRMLADVFA